MKKTLLFICFNFFVIYLFSQSPGFFNYQAVIRNSTGELITNQDVSFRISIITGSATGSTVFQEIHDTGSNNDGICNLKIGNGTSQTTSFDLIDWGVDSYYLKIEIDENAGTTYTNMGTVQLLSVPYSLYSSNAGISEYSVYSDTAAFASKVDSSIFADTALVAKDFVNNVLYFTDSDTLFAVKDREGNIVFAVFPDGAEIYVNETAKGKVGGFAVSGRSPSKAVKENYFVVTSDSTRVFVNEAAKGKVGGFAVSGRSPSKAIEEDYLVITADSTRVYVSQSETKGKVGGFAVSGRSPSKGVGNDYLSITKDSTRIYVADADAGFGVENTSSGTNERLMRLTKDNYFIGHQAGGDNIDGLYNTFLGYQSGIKHSTGNNNIYIGYKSAYNDTSGQNNIFMGNQTGYNNKNGSDNLFIGDSTGYNNTNGSGHVFLGHNAGASNTTGNHNSFVGYKSGQHNTSGDYNAFFGTNAGYSNTIGEYNAFFGSNAGYSVVGGTGEYNGSNNAFFGSYAGYSTTTGFCNVFIGPFAGYTNTTGRENVFIGLMAGRENTTGFYNTFVGKTSGYYNTTGNLSTFVGFDAGLHNTIGSANAFFGASAGTYNTEGYNNTFIGAAAGYNNTTGFGNVFIGFNAGKNETGSNKLYIQNSESPTPLIYGNFTDGAEQVEIFGHFVVKQDFWVEGIAGGASAWNSSSDKRLKKNITTLPNALNRVKQLRGVNFEWKDTTKYETGIQMGFIAQEALEIIPEVVEKNGEYYSMKYASITAILVEAVKEQQTLIENQNKKISNVEKENEELKVRLTEIENLKSQNQELKQKLDEIIIMLEKK